MTTDPPKPDNRDEFIEWMVGRDFKFEQPNGALHIHIADWHEETTDVPEGVSPDDLNDVKTNSVFLRYTELQAEERVVDGEYATAYITTVHPPEDPSDVSEVPFDSIRIQYMKGRLTEL